MKINRKSWDSRFMIHAQSSRRPGTWIRRMRPFAYAATFFLFPLIALAQEVVIPPQLRAAANRITAEKLANDVNYLASDKLGGRKSPSPGLDTAALFIARRLGELGLNPLGDQGTYFQHYNVRSVVADSTTSRLTISGQSFRAGEDFLFFGSPDTGTVRGSVAYVETGIWSPKHGLDPYAGLDVRDKWLLVHGPFALPKGYTFQSLGTFRVDWFSVAHEAMRRGARGVLYIPPTSALGRWERFRNNSFFRSWTELDPPVTSAYSLPAIPQIVLSPALTKLVLEGEPVSGSEMIAKGDSIDYPSPFPLAAAKQVALTTAGTKETFKQVNIIARIMGSDPKLRHEAVTIAAHLDGAVGWSPVDGDSVYNAADDNASGSVAILAVAEALKSAPAPRRSIILIWDTGEEVGLWGSRHLAENPPLPLKDVIAHFNVDMIGRTRAADDEKNKDLAGPNEVYLSGPRVLSAGMDSLIERTNRAFLNLTLNRRYDDVGSEFFYPRTDAGPFLERGVPIIEFFTGLHEDYHLPGDEAHKLDPRKMEQVARTVLVTAWLLADHPERLTADKGIPATVPRY